MPIVSVGRPLNSQVDLLLLGLNPLKQTSISDSKAQVWSGCIEPNSPGDGILFS